jgi:hypothetical protein
MRHLLTRAESDANKSKLSAATSRGKSTRIAIPIASLESAMSTNEFSGGNQSKWNSGQQIVRRSKGCHKTFQGYAV